MALTELGEQQAKAVAARIAANWKPAAVYSSPMRRCQATAAVIARACEAPSEVLDDLNDLDYGEWQWRTHEEVRAAAPDLLTLWYDMPQLVRFPSGESLQDLAARSANVLRLMMQRHARAAETVVLVGHDSVNRALLTQLLDQPLSAYWRLAQQPCAINEIDIEGRRMRVLRVNDISHLDAITR